METILFVTGIALAAVVAIFVARGAAGKSKHRRGGRWASGTTFGSSDGGYWGSGGDSGGGWGDGGGGGGGGGDGGGGGGGGSS